MISAPAPAFRPIDWEAIQDTLWQWFRDVSGCETIWANQAAPQPAYPYASLNILPGTLNHGALDEQRIQDDGTLAIVGPRDFVLSCQIHVAPEASNNPDCDARTRAHAIVSSIAVPPWKAELAAVNIGIRERGQIQMLDLVVGAQWIKRAQVDLRFGTMSNVDVSNWPAIADIGYFDKVEVSSDLQGLRPGSGLNLDEEILDPNA
jgi:hypothetical protein